MKMNIQNVTSTRSPPNGLKRAVTLLLVLSLSVSFLAVPVSASSTDSENAWMELLDFGYIQHDFNKEEHGADYQAYISGNRTEILDAYTLANFGITQEYDTFYFNLPYGMTVNYVDILYYAGSDVDVFMEAGLSAWSHNSLQVDSIGDNFYRAYGYIPEHTYTKIEFNVVSYDVSFLNVYSCRVMYAGNRYNDLTGQSTVSLTVGAKYIVDYPQLDSLPWDQIISGYDIDQSFVAQAVIPFDSWRTYDYLDLGFYFHVGEIDSIDVQINQLAVPYDANYITTGSIYGDYLYIRLRIDVTDQLDNEGPLVIAFNGTTSTDLENTFMFLSAKGIINIRYADPVLYWLMELAGLHQDVIGGIDNIGKMIEDTAHFFNDIYVQLVNNIVPGIDKIYAQLLNNIAPGITNIYNVLSNYFPILQEEIIKVNASIGRLTEDVNSWFNDLSWTVIEWFKKTNETIGEWGQKISDLLSPDSSAAEKVGDDMASQATEMEDMNDKLDNTTKPDVGSIDANLNDVVSSDDIVSATSCLTVVFTNELTGTIFVLALLFMLAAYVLYGKR